MDEIGGASSGRPDFGSGRGGGLALSDRAEQLAESGAELAAEGRLDEALERFRRAVRLRPDSAEAQNDLGNALRLLGRLDEAIDRFDRALRLRPDCVEAHLNRGLALAARGRRDEAADAFRAAVRLRPDEAGAHQHLASMLAARGDHVGSVAHYERAIRLRPDSAEAENGLAHALRHLGRFDEAFAHYRRALRLRPDATALHHNVAAMIAARGADGDALSYASRAHRLAPGEAATYFELGTWLLRLRLYEESEATLRHALRLRPDDPDALNNLGTAVFEQGRFEEAEGSFRAADRLRPDDPNTLNNLGNAAWEQGRGEEAVATYRAGLRLRDDAPELLTNLGIALSGLGELDEALKCLRRALRLRPRWPSALLGLGMTLGRQGKLDEAIDCYDHILAIQPDFAEAHRNRAMARLSLGDFERGWPEYAWRWRCKGPRLPDLLRPIWDGGDVAGRTLLLLAEQGFGDAMQFVRYAPLLKARGARVLLACPKPLLRLLSRCDGLDGVMTVGSSLPEFDAFAPLMDLPALLGTTPDTIPADVPYLSADPESIARRGRELEGIAGFRVGVAWQGNPRYPLDRMRSFPLACLEPLARVAGVRLVSLQAGPGTEQLDAPEVSFPVDRPGGPGLGDFHDTAALVKNLDLVVTPDLSVAHLAGGLGVPTWLALPSVAEWRWLIGREDSPWYPTLRLFRQDRPGDWAGVFRRMAEALAREIGA